jgi:hypothetical protein
VIKYSYSCILFNPNYQVLESSIRYYGRRFDNISHISQSFAITRASC